jgi:hypothetical protein
MGRVFFPTYSLNRFGVRDTDQRATLGAVIRRFDSEPSVRAANAPTGPMLGMILYQGATGDGSIYSNGFSRGGVCPAWGCGAPPIVRPIVYNPPISSSGGGGAVPTPPVAPPAVAAPVSTQVGPTPTVSVPPPTPTPIVLVSSGGGTQTPPTPTVVAPPVTYTTDGSGNIVNSAGAQVLTAAQAASMGTSAATLNASAAAAASPSLTNQVTAWLGGSTSLFNYNVPNALLTAVVVLGFAWLSSGKKR